MKIWSVAFLCWILGVGVLLAQAQDSSSFISIDCGASSSYVDTNLTVQYSTDVGFVDSGQNLVISSSYLSQVPYQQFKNLRVFPNGTRNCYTLKPTQGKNNKYLIRASFFYGNYDGKSQAGSFDLHIDVNYWATVSPPSGWTYLEIVYTPSRDYIQVCLVNRGQGSGTPFISALELRLLDSTIYPITSGALVLYSRFNDGSPTTYRFPHDDYDRIWLGTTSNSLVSITNTTAINFKSNDNYKVPAEVLMSAFATPNSSYYYYGAWSNPNSTTNWYMYFHFAEIQILQPGQVRAFKVYVEGNVLTTVTPVYLTPMTVVSPPASGSTIVYNISSTTDSNLAPFLNALEVYYAIDLPNSQTDIDDVNAINAVKNAYGINRVTWQGDPCAPRDYIWSGLNCSQDTSPRIISLNLSSNGLTGQIDISFSSLAALVSLDLSSNKLTGQLPEFFAQMPNLKSLNLAGNSLSGSIPDSLKKKMSDGTLNVILTGNPICQTESCTSSPTGPSAVPSPAGHKTNIIPIVIAVVASILVLVILIVLVICYRRRKRNNGPNGGAAAVNDSRPSYGDGKSLDISGGSQGIGQVTRNFTSSEVSSITENFKVTIGEGGFGNVFLGTLSDGRKVAVKVLSPESKQGYKEFQTEAQLLMMVHHKNLVSLLGYCDELENMALIYELMPHGNLRQHLSADGVHILRWNQRLQIAVDAAQGLEYLHNGCRPPIIHRDLKTSNILLDENMQAKIADFGLSRIFIPEYNESYVSTRPAGTPGYLDPVFQTTGNLNKKSDIYSFGIILFELITGHPAIIRSTKSSTHIVQWVTPLIERGDLESIVDPRMQGHYNANSVWKVIEIAMNCVHLIGSQRPDINQVLTELKESLAMETNSRGTGGNYPKTNSFEMTSVELNLAPAAR